MVNQERHLCEGNLGIASKDLQFLKLDAEEFLEYKDSRSIATLGVREESDFFPHEFVDDRCFVVNSGALDTSLADVVSGVDYSH